MKALNCDDCDDEDIEGKKEYKENQGIFRLIKKLIMNPLNAYRILDIFLMVLPMDQNNEILKRIFEGKTKFLPNLKNKILAQIEVFLKKKYVLPLLLKENNISATGNSVFDNANVIILFYRLDVHFLNQNFKHLSIFCYFYNQYKK